MTATTRRIYLYWVLLLISALGVGGGAWMLLRREEARFAKRAITAEAARRTAVEARAQLVAENVELFVGDVEAGLLDTLAAAPVAQLDGFLDNWERSNPLVRMAFRCGVNGALLRPLASNTADEARGFRRRFAVRLTENAPWLPPAPAPGLRETALQKKVPEAKQAEAATGGSRGVAQEKKAQESKMKDQAPALEMAEAETRRQVSSNVSSFQRARKETQEMAKVSAPAAADGVASAKREYALKPEADLQVAVVAGRGDAAAVFPEAVPVADRRGWLAWAADGRLHLLGWLQPGATGEVRGVEMELTALVSRLGGALPPELAGDEGYALRDDKGRVLHQAGTLPVAGTAPSVRVPLASELLPGWEVVGFLSNTGGVESAGFFLVGVLLAGILVVAIVAGGSLLLWQARRSEAEAEQKTSFVANVSHEFKTPLTTIRLYSDLLEQGRVPDGEKRGEYLRTIGRETQRLARLVNNVLDFSRLEQGRKKFEREPLELSAVLRQMLEAHAPRLAEAGLELKGGWPAVPVPATSDRDALEQIVLNLLDNACKYAAVGGEVAVALRARAEGGVELRVGDRGPGVPAGERERVFEKFHRVDDTLTSEKSGAGLGLSIARQLARGLGGDLRCVARDGGGAEFVLTLP